MWRPRAERGGGEAEGRGPQAEVLRGGPSLHLLRVGLLHRHHHPHREGHHARLLDITLCLILYTSEENTVIFLFFEFVCHIER